MSFFEKIKDIYDIFPQENKMKDFPKSKILNSK